MSEPWQRLRLGATYDVRDQRAGAEAESLPLMSVSQTRGVVPRSELVGDQGRAEDLANYKICEPGDIVLNRMSAYNGALGVAHERGVVSPDYLVMTPRVTACPEFIAAWLKTPVGVFEMSSRLRGIGSVEAAQVRTPRVNESDLKTISLQLPPVEEQRAIVDYLERETARIDKLIEEQQRLIAMLRERREATVRSVLLAGLESADVAPSGVDAFGLVPQHWRMVPTRYLCEITTGSEDSGNAVEDGEYPFYVRGREILRIDHYSYDGEAVMTPGDGQGGTGKVFHYFEGKFEAHQRVYVFKDFVGVSGRYFYYFLSTFLRPVALAGSNTVTMESLRRPLLADFKIAVPPLDEQARITVYLDERLARIDELIAEAERFIKLSRERRSALTAAAVTGQLDVRAVA